MYRDDRYNPESDTAPREETEYERRVRLEVHRHTDENPFREDTDEAPREEDTPKDPKNDTRLEEDQPRVRKRRRASTARQLLTGSILIREDISKYYRYLWGIAAMCFVSIFVMFLALQCDVKCSRLEREVRILRARAIIMESRRFHQTTHTAIVRELEARNIPLRTPERPARKLDD